MGIQSIRAFLLGNINESVPTDDAIYHRLGVLNFNAQNTGTRERIAKSLGMNHGNEYRCMIKFCKDGRGHPRRLSPDQNGTSMSWSGKPNTSYSIPITIPR